MRKQLLILSCVMVLASCNSSSNNAYQVQQAQIDSTVNDLVAKHEAENARRKDSMLSAIEKEKADSITKGNEPQKKKRPVEQSK